MDNRLYFRRPLLQSRKKPLIMAALTSLMVLMLWRVQIYGHVQKISYPAGGSSQSSPQSSKATLGVASKIYVISLPTKTQRRKQLEFIRERLGLHWTYFDGVEATSTLVTAVMHWVELIRTGPPMIINEAQSNAAVASDDIEFTWPSNIDDLSYSQEALGLRSTGIWLEPNDIQNAYPIRELVCARKNFHIVDYTIDLPEHLILTRPRIACWHSHLTVIHDIANRFHSSNNDVAIVLEDDVDMEKDIHRRLRYIWDMLPARWDIVFLGHCWSNESYYPPLKQEKQFEDADHFVSGLHLHPSKSPKCTHAYALSRVGARRLLQYLRYPPFAYSRAIDQAIAWLVEDGRLKGYSVVPSVIVQRKVDDSDVTSGIGSNWKDKLLNPILAEPSTP